MFPIYVNYPNAKEIIKELKPVDDIVKTIVNIWKKNYYIKKWKQTSEMDKRKNLVYLIECLSQYFLPSQRLPVKFKWEDNWNYIPKTNTITGKKENLSIISALHELGHAIYGISELKACVFSIEIFKACFPKEFKKLKWEGHMLMK